MWTSSTVKWWLNHRFKWKSWCMRPFSQMLMSTRYESHIYHVYTVIQLRGWTREVGQIRLLGLHWPAFTQWSCSRSRPPQLGQIGRELGVYITKCRALATHVCVHVYLYCKLSHTVLHYFLPCILGSSVTAVNAYIDAVFLNFQNHAIIFVLAHYLQ